MTREYNEFYDKLANYELSMLAQKAGFDDYTPECWTKHPEEGWVCDEWTGLIGEPHEFECHRHTLSNLASWLREIKFIQIDVLAESYDGIHRSVEITKLGSISLFRSEKLKKLILPEWDYDIALEKAIQFGLEYLISKNKE